MTSAAVAVLSPSAAAPRARTKVMQVTDWLEPGGKERVAVNLANLLPRDRFDSYLCTTRRSHGGLENVLATDVRRLRLDRTRALDLAAVRRLVAFNAAHQIDVLHAHGSSLFMASLASLFPPFPAVVWHDHYGPYRRHDRPEWLYRLAAARIGGVIAVNHALLDWSRQRLRVHADRAWYLPNFVCDAAASPVVKDPGRLPGRPGWRIACVAHLRPQKDHETLLNALALVVAEVPDVHLLLIGGESNPAYTSRLTTLVAARGLGASVTFMGRRDDVPAILAQCDIGVLSSESEGFPLALIEYGLAGLAAISTNVGQCAEILDHGRSGLLVEAGQPNALAQALTLLLTRADRRRSFALALRQRVRDCYSSGPLLDRICGIYDTVLAAARR